MAGQRFRVLPWQADFLDALPPSGIAALTMARGGGKTAFVSTIAAASIAGPLRRPGLQTLVVASSFAQGVETTFRDVLAYIEPFREAAPNDWRVLNSMSTAMAEHLPTGARLRVLGSDSRRMHGARPGLAILDEPAQWAQPDRMYSAILTGMGKVPDAKMLVIGTRADEEGHFFTRLLDGGADVVRSYAVPADAADPTDEAAWRLANPSVDAMPHLLKEIRRQAADAKRDTALLATFKALRCNMGVADIERRLIVEAGTWQAAERMKRGKRRGRFALGLDLGGTAAATGASAYWPKSGRLETFAVFGSGDLTLAERGRKDAVGDLYERMADRGELILCPGPDVPAEFLLAECARRWGHPAAIACDRWREGELRRGLDDAGYPLAALNLRGQGFRDGGEDLRLFRREVGRGRVRPGVSLLLRAALAGAVAVVDSAGNEKLATSSAGGRRARHRDDALASAIVAVAEGARRATPR